MNIMTKRGNADNIVTYEHFCDTVADLSNIPASQATLGSVAIVVNGEEEGMGIYIANSQKEWVPITTSTGGGGGEVFLDLIHICNSSEYDSVTRIPTIEEPETNMIYLVPNNGSENNIFDEWIYANNAWEKFGSGNIGTIVSDVQVKGVSVVTNGIANIPTAAENGIPTGGTTGQVLKKTGAANYATGWETLNLNSLSDVQVDSYGEDSILTYKAGRWVNGNPVVSYMGNIEEGTDPDGTKYIIDPGFSDPIYAQTVNGDSVAWDLWWNVYNESVYLLNRTAGSPFNPQMRRFTYNSEMGWYEEAALAQANEVTGMWTGTQAEYDAITEKDAHKVYFIQE